MDEWLRRLRYYFRRREFEAELEEELEYHRALSGARQFGNVTRLREESRTAWQWRWLEDLGQDLRFAFRQYRKRPGFAALAVLTLAFGVGTTTAVYTVVHAVLLRPLPFADADNLMMVWDNAPMDGDRFRAIMVSPEDLEAFVKSSQTLDRFSSAGRIRPVFHYGGAAKRTIAGLVDAAMFRETLGSQALLGRTFVNDDLSAGCVVVLAHRFWARELGADADTVGHNLTFDDTPCTVIGIMPAGFDLFPIQADMWFLRDHAPREAVEAARRGGYHNGGIVYARINGTATPEQAERELTGLHQVIHADDPASESSERERVVAVTPVRSAMAGVTAPSLASSLWLAFGAVVLLLLIACVNVANLLLARLADRQREMLVRSALGSGRLRLIRQLMVEGSLLALAGTALGVVFAWFGVQWYRFLNPFELPTQAGEVELNPSVLLFAIALAVVTTLLFSLLPAWAASGIDPGQRLRTAGRGFFGQQGRKRIGQVLVALELALSFVLLAGAGLLMSSVFSLETERLGFDVSGIVTVSAGMPEGRYPTRESRTAFEEALRERLQAMPGVSRVAFGSFPPNADGGDSQVEVEGRPVEKVFDVDVRPGSRDFYEILRVGVLRGRMFDDADHTGPAIAIVSQRFVEEYLGGEDPLGRSIRLINGDVRSEWRTIVGVIGPWKHMVGDVAWRETPVVFTTGGKPPDRPSYGISVGVQASGDLGALAREIQLQIARLEPNAVFPEPEVLSRRLDTMMAYPRFRAILLIIFGVGALLLAAAGVHGVVAQLVAQRIPEFGLRRAVGAQGSDLAWMVLRQGGVAAVFGLLIGVISALALTSVVRGLWYGRAPTDPLILGGAAFVLLASASLAMAIPALRAARVDPITALRHE